MSNNNIPHRPIILQAATPAELARSAETTLTELKSEQADSHFQELANQSESKAIPEASARLGFIASDAKEAVGLLENGLKQLNGGECGAQWSSKKGVHFRAQGFGEKVQVAGLFSGQGSQYLYMGQDLYPLFPALKLASDQMDELFLADGLPRLSEIVHPAEAADKAQKKQQELLLAKTEHVQPSVGVMSMGLLKIAQSLGLKLDMVGGHSFGELSALWSAGVLEEAAYLELAKARGKAMAAPDDPDFDAGSMLAVKADAPQVIAEANSLDDIKVANFNSPNQVVLAGPKMAVENAESTLKEKGYSVVMLPVSAAFHTPLVGHAQKPFAAEIEKRTFSKPSISVFSNASAQPYPTEPEQMRRILKDHILNSVLFKDEIENMYEAGARVFVEFGPKSVLANLVENTLEGKEFWSVSLNGSAKKSALQQLCDAVVQLKVVGLDLKWFK